MVSETDIQVALRVLEDHGMLEEADRLRACIGNNLPAQNDLEARVERLERRLDGICEVNRLWDGQ